MLENLIGQGSKLLPQTKLEEIADKICAKGLAIPAIFFLEMHRPLCSLAHNVGEALLPLLYPLTGGKYEKFFLTLVSEPRNLEALISAIEARVASLRRQNKGA